MFEVANPTLCIAILAFCAGLIPSGFAVLWALDERKRKIKMLRFQREAYQSYYRHRDLQRVKR